MKVCMVSGNFVPTPGGTVTQMWHLCRALKQAGVDITVVTFGAATERDTSLGFPVYRFRFDSPPGPLRRKVRWLRFIRGLRQVLARERPDVVHCHDAHVHSFLTGAVARVARIPSVIKYAGDMVWEMANAHALRVPDFSVSHRVDLRARFLHLAEQRGLRLFDVVVAASQYRRCQLLGLGVPTGQIRVIPNLINLPTRPAGAARDPTPTIITAGQMVPRKRLEVLLHAFSGLNLPTAKLQIVGEGTPDTVRRLAAAAAGSGVGDRVEILGRVTYEHLMRLMSRATLYASASMEEGFGIVFVEAMALGLPVVAMRVGGIPEVVPDGQAGYLVEPDDREAMIDRLRLLLTDHARRDTMGDFGQRHSRQFELTGRLDIFLGLYRQLCG